MFFILWFLTFQLLIIYLLILNQEEDLEVQFLVVHFKYGSKIST